MFNKIFAASFRNAAAKRGGIIHTTTWHFLQQELQPVLYKLERSQLITDSDTRNTILFAQYCQNGLRKGIQFLKQIVSSHECQYSLLEVVNIQNRYVWVQSVSKLYAKPYRIWFY